MHCIAEQLLIRLVGGLHGGEGHGTGGSNDVGKYEIMYAVGDEDTGVVDDIR